MPETNKILSSYNDKTKQEDDYYTDTGKKVRDFCLGFFGFLIIGTICSLFNFTYFSGLFNNLFFSLFAASLLPIVAVLAIVSIVLSFVKRRRYIGIGIISLILIPFLIFGACLLVLAGSGGL